MSFDPTNVDFTAIRGGLYVNEFAFWVPTKPKYTEPYSLEAYTKSMVIEGVATLTVGSGLLITAANKIRFELTKAQTSIKDSAHYFLRFMEGEKGPYFIAKGIFYFEAP